MRLIRLRRPLGDAAATQRKKIQCRRKSLFTHTIEKQRSWDSKETFECRYKFAINAAKDARYMSNVPLKFVQEGGIRLVITIQRASQSRGALHNLGPLGTYFRTYDIPSSKLKKPLDDDDDEKFYEKVDDELKSIISPIVCAIGIISPEQHQSVTQLLVSSAMIEYLNNHHNWIQLDVDVLIEVRSSNILRDEHRDLFFWTMKDSTRFLLGLQLVLMKGRSNAADHETKTEEKEMCVICLNEFPDNCLLVRLPSCCHIYHEDCIRVWLRKNSNCPICRASTPSIFNLENPWRMSSKELFMD